MTSTESGRIWIGCLAAYNSGTLHGKWFPASDIREGIAEVMKTSPIPNAEEWFIADYDDFPNLGEYPSIAAIEQMAEALDSASDREAFTAYVASEGAQYASRRTRSGTISTDPTLPPVETLAEGFTYGMVPLGFPALLKGDRTMAGYDYDYDCLRYELLLRLPNGTVFMQGEEASELYDELEAITDEAALEAVLSRYSEVAVPDSAFRWIARIVGDE